MASVPGARALLGAERWGRQRPGLYPELLCLGRPSAQPGPPRPRHRPSRDDEPAPALGLFSGSFGFRGPSELPCEQKDRGRPAQPAAVWTLPPVPGRPVGPTGEGGAGPPSLPCSSSSSLPCSFPSSARARLISVRPSALGASDFSQRPQLTPRTRAAEADGGASGCAVPLAAPRDGSLSPPGRQRFFGGGGVPTRVSLTPGATLSRLQPSVVCRVRIPLRSSALSSTVRPPSHVHGPVERSPGVSGSVPGHLAHSLPRASTLRTSASRARTPGGQDARCPNAMLGPRVVVGTGTGRSAGCPEPPRASAALSGCPRLAGGAAAAGGGAAVPLPQKPATHVSALRVG